MSKGFDFENALVSFFRNQGYLAKRGIPLVIENSQDATDIDVYGIKFTYPFIETNLVCDCKNKTRPKPFERVFWTKGMAEYVKVDNVYVALPKVQTKVAKFASTIGVNILTRDKIQMAEKSEVEYDFDNYNIDKDKELLLFYRKVKQLYIVKNPYVLYNSCVNNIEFVVRLRKEKGDEVNKKLNIILAELIVLLAVALLRICNKLISLDDKGIEDELISKLTYGEIPEDKANNILNSVSRLAIEIIKNETGVVKYRIEDFNFIKEPEYTQDVIGLVKRIMNNPSYYIDLPQMIDYIIYEAVVNDKEVSKESVREIFGDKLIEEKIKACKNILFFTNRFFATEFNVDKIFAK